MNDDSISRNILLRYIADWQYSEAIVGNEAVYDTIEKFYHMVEEMPSTKPEQIARDIATIIENERDMRVILKNAQDHKDKYEYHYDHTDCIWYRPEARNRCPVTCAQYRDGWNDAMNYIFHDGKGYRPYRRDKKYEERREE